MRITTLEIIIAVGLGLTCLLSVFLTALRMPGTWVIVAAAAGHGWWTGWTRVTLLTLAVLIGAAVVGEAAEMFTSMLTARRAGASRRAVWGGLIGGFVGMILFSIPIPLIGTVLGALLGCFAGAAIAEFTARKELGQGARVGAFAAIGFVLGAAAKTALAMAMSGWLMFVVFRGGGVAGLPAAP